MRDRSAQIWVFPNVYIKRNFNALQRHSFLNLKKTAMKYSLGLHFVRAVTLKRKVYKNGFLVICSVSPVVSSIVFSSSLVYPIKSVGRSRFV